MASWNEIKNLIKKYKIQANKNLGQNFLFEDRIITKIIKATNIKGQDVIEIGPGLGSLTLALLREAKTVRAYEISHKMTEVLENEIQNNKFRLIKSDFLSADFNWSTPRIIVANVPYNITTKIIFKIIENIRFFSQAILMVQKEFGQRMVAQPKTKNYGKLSVAIQSIAQVAVVTIVERTNFIPAPKVDSMVVKIIFKDQYDKAYFDFLLNCFAKQRKKLTNNLQNIIAKDKLEHILKTNGFKLNVRPQELSPKALKKLWNIISESNC